MKRTKKLYLLLGVLLAVCGITFGVSKVEEHKEVIRNSDEIILTLEPDQVKSLSWENETEALAFHKTDEGNWVYDTDEAFPVDEEKITELLEQFTEFGVSFVIEEVEDFGLYGLDEPVCTINLETEEESYEILLGDYSKMDSKRYVSIGDGKAYLVQNDPLDYYDATLKDMIAHDEIPALDQVTQVVFSGSENYQISYEENSSNTYCDEDVYFTQKDEAVLPLDTTLVNGYLQNISALNPTEYVNYKVTEEELETYGLDDPELSVEIAYTKSDEEEKEVTDTFVLHVSRDPEEKAKAQEAENTETAEDTGEEAAMTEVTADESEEVTAYVRIGDSGIIYQIDGTAYENLMAASQNDLRHKEVFSGSFTDISQLDISLEDTVYLSLIHI